MVTLNRSYVISLCVMIWVQGYGPMHGASFSQEPATWHVTLMDSPTTVSLRGLSVPSPQVIWACGSQGVVVKSADRGATWQKRSIPGFETLEFRSIHAWDDRNAIVASAGQPAIILKTTDGGDQWIEVYRNHATTAFIDALVVAKDGRAMAFSDPVAGRIVVMRSDNTYSEWTEVDPQSIPLADEGEAAFAASNGSLMLLDGYVWIGLGGGNGGPSRVLMSKDFGDSWQLASIGPIPRGTSSGIFAVVFRDLERGVALGGDYQREDDPSGSVAFSTDGGRTWNSAAGKRPRGFRSSGCYVEGLGYVCAGPSGCEWSETGSDWHPLTDVGFHAIRTALDGSIWGVGATGRIGRIALAESK